MGENIHGLSIEEAGESGIKAIKQLCKDLRIPEKLRDVGVTEDELPEMAKLAFAADYNRWNPRYTSEDAFRMLYEKAF
jgi:alcohol dehydrogenase